MGIGNIGGVALAISLGGPGAVFWMWIVGGLGMALKMVEVTLSMLHRDLTDTEQPQGGPMFVARHAFAALGHRRLGNFVGGLFVATLLVSSVTGGNMFQAWNVAEVTNQYFGVPKIAVGVVLSVVVGLVIVGGIRRIGLVAGRLVPFMCVLYLLAAIVVLLANVDTIPDVLRSIFVSAFAPTEAGGAFLGGTAGYAKLWGLKRALFSREVGQGSSPIAHCAAKTDEPVREGIVAGLEPFIDTLVVCTLTALVILTSGIWNRPVDVSFTKRPAVVQTGEGSWSLTRTVLHASAADSAGLRPGVGVFTVVRGDPEPDTGDALHVLPGTVGRARDGAIYIDWAETRSSARIEPVRDGAFFQYQGAALTARAFDHTFDGVGKWLVTFAAWLFAISTMISWSYYGEQGVRFLAGRRSVLGYKLFYCAMVIVATIPELIPTDRELDDLTTLGTGVMLWANIPILLVFARGTMRAYHDYIARLGRSEFEQT